MKKFVAIYRIPLEIMQEWRKTTPPEEMKRQGEKIGADMNAWIQKHDASIVDKGLPLGKNVRVTKDKLEATPNDLNAYCVIEADSAEAVAEMFKDNPHFQIPGAFLDVMEIPHWEK